jgi:hypothetical protein
MIPDLYQLVLAALGGIGFGYIISRIGTDWRLIGIMLVILWTMDTGPQFLYRWINGTDVQNEVVIVTILRATFLLATVVVVAIGNRRDRRGPARPGASWPWRKED